MKSGWGILGTLAAAAAGVIPLTGCMTYSCSAIGYSNTVTVALEGNFAVVGEVRLCDETTCSRLAPEMGAPGPARTIEPTFSPEAEPPAPVTSAPYFATKTDNAVWEVNVDMRTPRNATVSALTADGTVLVSQNVELTWTRVGGSEQCGGPMSAPPIELRGL
ncbi:hypothetical protein SAMN04489743_1453 [Pseudarthrobacter equi]|uniref:Uncharacterized protein n=1 Tax=Pseudarthrobacter equi TaxID=728066 RepID=A0A1H1WV51_9MICC|nr:hypothetical protein [Pseudarthrobacter equi]SDT01027.1 hypothetical protein SAMN04489743_1453 [Pseudarthrobacter equi]